MQKACELFPPPLLPLRFILFLVFHVISLPWKNIYMPTSAIQAYFGEMLRNTFCFALSCCFISWARRQQRGHPRMPPGSSLLVTVQIDHRKHRKMLALNPCPGMGLWGRFPDLHLGQALDVKRHGSCQKQRLKVRYMHLVLSSLPDNSSGAVIQAWCTPELCVPQGTSCHHSPWPRAGVLTGACASRVSALSAVMSLKKINTFKMFPSSTIMIILGFELPAVEHFLNWIPHSLSSSNKHEWQFHLALCVLLRDVLWRLAQAPQHHQPGTPCALLSSVLNKTITIHWATLLHPF